MPTPITPQDRAYADAMSRVAAAHAGRSRHCDALRGSVVPAPAETWHAGPRESHRRASARCAGGGAETRHPASRRLSPLHPHHGIDLRAGARHRLREHLGTRFPAPATSTTCRRTPGARWGDGGMPFRPAFRRGNPIRRRPKVRGLRPIPRTTCRCSSSPPPWTDRVRWRSRRDAASRR